MVTLNRSALVVKPKEPFLDWLHTADPTSRRLTLQELVREPAIYLIPECDTNGELDEVLRELCEEIFIEQLAGWFNDRTTWPHDRGFEVFCRWFDFQHHSMVVDLCDHPWFSNPTELPSRAELCLIRRDLILANHNILAAADYLKVIVESNESNNANGFPITVVP